MYYIALLIVLCVLWFVWRERKRPPGPMGVPFLGYLPFLDVSAPYLTLTSLAKRHGPIYGLHLGNVYTVVLSDVRVIRKVLSRDVFSGRAPLYLTHGIMKGYGLICSEGELWKDQRKFAVNCLRYFGAVRSRRDKIEGMLQQGVEDLVKHLDSSDYLPTMRHCLGNVMNAIVFGHTFPQGDRVWEWLQNLQETGTKHIGVAGPLNFLPWLRFVPKFKRVMKYLTDGKESTHVEYRKLIQRRLERLGTQEPGNVIDAFLTRRARLEADGDPASRHYSDEQFCHLLADIFGAGLDTTLVTLEWFFLYVAAYEAEQTNIRNEMRNVLGDRAPTLDDMDSMPYTQAAIAEAQRIRSVVPIGIPHGALEDTEIEGFRVPKGTMVVPLQWAVHMDPEVWRDPELFSPSRFLENGRFVKPDNFMPFQTGRRVCIGDDLARMMLFLFGATVLQKFDVSCSDIDLVGECGITLTPKKHRLVFARR